MGMSDTEGDKMSAANEHFPLVQVENLWFGYGATPVLEDVSFTLRRGQFAAVVGPSGAGKTTLLRLILGLLKPNRGYVTIAGERVNGRPSVHIGYVPQLNAIDWTFPVTVEQVVLMGRIRQAPFWPWYRRQDKARMEMLLEQLGIAHLRRRHIRDLSGGQQQRVFLARALMADPDLLILDEPTAGVDMHTAEQILHLLADLNRAGKTVLITTHDLNTAAAHVPWMLCLNGRLIAQGPPEAVLVEDILNRTYRAEMVVIRQNGLLLVHQKPHAHTYRDLLEGEFS